MEDKEIIKRLPKTNVELPNIVGRNFKFLSCWADQNETQFEQVMRTLAEQMPAKYADVYVKVLQILSVQAKAPSKVKVEVHDGDLDKLRNLSKQREKNKFDDYEEV